MAKAVVYPNNLIDKTPPETENPMILERVNQQIVETFKTNRNMDEDEEFNDYQIFTAIANGTIEVEDEEGLYGYLDDVISQALEGLSEDEMATLRQEMNDHEEYNPIDLKEVLEAGHIEQTQVGDVQLLNFISEQFFNAAENEEDVVGDSLEDEEGDDEDEDEDDEDQDKDENETDGSVNSTPPPDTKS